MAEDGGYCSIHAGRLKKSKEQRYDENRPSSSARGYNRTHQKLRKLVMAEQPICAAEGCEEPGVELDHIDGNQWNRSRENLQMLCKSHHSEKTMKGLAGGRAKPERRVN